jgi:hypothetical protein
VKRKSSENNGNLVSKQAKACAEVTLIYFCHLVEVFFNNAWPVFLVVTELFVPPFCAVLSVLYCKFQILAIISALKQMEII